MTLYNKYRPKSFKELVQSKYAKGLSTNELTHHAYMFFGPPGTGKTSAARLCMTKYVDEKDSQFCVDGKHPDYFEINCAINNGVDDVRRVVSDIVNTSPMTCKYKFVIFDEAHMLTTQSQNALLKTVEEPPKHIKFFFCTTELNKVLPAIRSRCQIIPFLKLPLPAIEKVLKNVCVGENIKYNEESGKMLASLADGSARTAINLFEQCQSVFNDSDAVAQIIGTASMANFHNLTKLICDKNKPESIKLMNQLFANTIDPNSLMNKYADFLAELISLNVVANKTDNFELEKLLIISEHVCDILKDFKILQNIKLISEINVLKAIEKM
jgi:DNA polymerase-3 subunit gamma/tau